MQKKVKEKPKKKYKPQHAKAMAKKRSAPAKTAREEKEQIPKQSFLKRLIFGEEKPDLSELEAGSTTILDILSPTAVDTKSRDYIVVDGVYHNRSPVFLDFYDDYKYTRVSD